MHGTNCNDEEGCESFHVLDPSKKCLSRKLGLRKDLDLLEKLEIIEISS